MKPSEFWAQIFALPEQARQAESDASSLRREADALCEWAKVVLDKQRRAIALADEGQLNSAILALSELPPRPDARSTEDDVPPLDDARSYVEKHGNVARRRKQRSDAGKPRSKGLKSAAPTVAISDSDPDPVCSRCLDIEPGKEDTRFYSGPTRTTLCDPCLEAVNPQVSLTAKQILRLLEAELQERGTSEPFTIVALDAAMGVGEERLREALQSISYVSWRMQRDGDSKPVEVWGTVEQFAQHVGRMSVKSGDRIADTIAKFGCSEFDAKRVWRELDPRGAA